MALRAPEPRMQHRAVEAVLGRAPTELEDIPGREERLEKSYLACMIIV